MSFFPFFRGDDSPSYAQFDSERTLWAAGVAPNCGNYELTCIDCGPDPDIVFQMDIEFASPEYKREIQVTLGADGLPIMENVIMSRVFSIDYITDDTTDNGLETYLTLAKEVTLQKIGTPQVFDLIQIETSVIDATGPMVAKRMTFQCKQYPPISKMSCCDSAFAEPGTLPGGGGPPDTNPCTGITGSLGAAGDTLTLTVGGAGSWSSVWMLDGDEIGTNLSSYVMVLYGTYSVNVNAEGCQLTMTYDYENPCGDFEVTITGENGALDADVPAAYDTATFVWEYSEDGITYTAFGTGSAIGPVDAGFYRVTATQGDCEDTAIWEWTGCLINAEIVKDGNILTWTSLDVPPLVPSTWQWSVDLGDGLGRNDLVGETTETHTALVTGLYYVQVALESGCTQDFQILHIMCGDCATFGVIVSNTGSLITATVDGCGEPTYEWYAVNPDGSKDLLLEDTNEYTLPDDGLYFLVVCCLNCPPQVFLISKAGATIIITDGQLQNGFAWGGGNGS